MICIDAADLGASRPGAPLFSGLSVTVRTGDRVGVVGRNGSGKSTLLRLLAGTDRPEQGVVRFGRDVQIAVLDQSAPLPAGTVSEAVGGGWEGAAALERLGMGGLGDRDTAALSGGQAKRVALARTLLHDSDVLVLDEPTNHLDLDGVEWLEERLAASRAALVLVTHDRHVLDRLTTVVLELDRGTGYLHVPSGEHRGSGYAAYLAARAEREERAADAEATRRNLARRELEWLRRGAPARTSKPQARVDAARALIAERPLAPARAGDLDLDLGSARLGSKVLELHGVGHHRGGAWLFRGLDLTLAPGARLGIVGPNGTGKSTLLDLVAGRLAPQEGTIERGTTVRIGYHDQIGVTLDPDQTVLEAVTGPHRVTTHAERRLCERFWFGPDAQRAPIRLLSGGERRRLQLLLVLAAEPNVLLLDEPTNDLDLDTLRALEDHLDGFDGAVVVVSHDRTFLDRTVDLVLALDDGVARLVRGGYGAWAEERHQRRTQRRPAGAPSAPQRSSGSLTTTPTAPATRSTSTLGRLLRDAEKALESATRDRDRLAAEMATVTDHSRLADLGHALAEADAQVASAEERWLEIAAEAEAAAAAKADARRA